MFFLLFIFAPFFFVSGQATCSINSLNAGNPCNYCPLANKVTLGANTSTANPNQDIYIGEYSKVHYYGHQTPLTADQTINAWLASDSINIGTLQSSSQNITLGYTNPTGAPTLTTSSPIYLRGRYHSIYSSNCRPNSGPDWAKLVCLSGTSGNYYNGYVTNAALSGSVTPTLPPASTASPTATLSPTVSRTVTSGYDVVFNEWHPPEPGYYLITFSAYFTAGGRAEIKIVINNVLKEGAIAWGPASTSGTGSTSVIAQFDATGTGYYIYVNGQTMYSDTDPNWSAYQARLNIVRVA